MHTNLLLVLTLVLSIPALSGCSLGYLGHVTSGQLRLLRARQPIDALLADATTPAGLRGQLELVQQTRAYAEALGLEVDGNYTSYAPWPGDRIVTTLVATKPGEVEPAGFWFPLVGRLPYKGYFDQERAAREADRLRADGLDVCEVAVPAYSTLGWFDDPVTEPMLRRGDGVLVETLIHELVHATVFVTDDADFSEGVAAFIGEEGSVRFYRENGRGAEAERRRAEVRDARLLDDARLALRKQVETLYTEATTSPERAATRASLETATRGEIAVLPLETRDAAQLSELMRLNDACLALAATYAADIGYYTETLSNLDGDLQAFIARLRSGELRPNED